MEINVAEELDDEESAFIRSQWIQLGGIQSGMASPKGVAITARVDDEIVGALKGWCAGGVAYLTELMIAEPHRGAGVGSEMLRKYEERCTELDSRRLALRTDKGGSAQRFYERNGWFVEHEVSDWIDGHTYVQMRKDLKP